MAQIVVIGSGFAGLAAVRTLRKQHTSDSITVISPAARLFFYPSLVWALSGQRQESDLDIDVSNFYRSLDVDHIAAHVYAVDDETRIVKTTEGSVPYDKLIVTAGAYYQSDIAGLEHACLASDGWDSVARFKEVIDALPGGNIALGFGINAQEKGIANAGVIYEMLIAVDDLLREQGRRDKFQLHFFSSVSDSHRMPDKQRVGTLLRTLRQRSIHTHLGLQVDAFTPSGVQAANGRTIDADLIYFMPPMQGSDWAQQSGLETTPTGFIHVDKHCQVESSRDIFAAGDAAAFPMGGWHAKQMQLADKQGEVAALNAMAELHNGQKQQVKMPLGIVRDELTTEDLIYHSLDQEIVRKAPVFYWMKRLSEWKYLRKLKTA